MKVKFTMPRGSWKSGCILALATWNSACLLLCLDLQRLWQFLNQLMIWYKRSFPEMILQPYCSKRMASSPGTSIYREAKTYSALQTTQEYHSEKQPGFYISKSRLIFSPSLSNSSFFKNVYQPSVMMPIVIPDDFQVMRWTTFQSCLDYTVTIFTLIWHPCKLKYILKFKSVQNHKSFFFNSIPLPFLLEWRQTELPHKLINWV